MINHNKIIAKYGVLLRKRAEETIESELQKTDEVIVGDIYIVATYNLIYNASFFVEEGFGYAITLNNFINAAPDNNLCFKPLIPNLRANLVMVWKKYQLFSKASQIFL